MSNLSYCRFENTVGDLQDCCDAWEDSDDLSQSEERSRKRLLQLCQDIVAEYGDDEEE